MKTLVICCLIFDVLYYAMVRFYDITAKDDVDNAQVMLLQSLG